MLHWEPFFGNFKIQLGVGQGALLETFPKIGGPVSLDIVQHRLGDKTTAVAFGGQSVKNLKGCIWKDDIEAFAHKCVECIENVFSFYTHSVCISNSCRTGIECAFGHCAPKRMQGANARSSEPQSG